MFESLTKKLKEHIRENLIFYTVIFVFFLGGIILGGYVFSGYKKEELQVLPEFFSNSMSIIGQDGIRYNEVFRISLKNGLFNSFAVWVLGFTVIGMPLILLIVAKSGFVMGFLTAFLLSAYGGKTGSIIAIPLLLAKCSVLIPVLFLLSGFSLSLSLFITRVIFGNIRYRVSAKSYIFSYCGLIALVILGSIAYAFVETYFSSNLLKLTYSYFLT